MKTQDGIKPAYNAQIAVDSAHRVIVAQELVTAQNDYHQLAGMVEQVMENCHAPPEAVSADAGYLAKDSLEQMEGLGIETYMPLPVTEAEKFERVQEEGAYRCPAGHLLRPYRVREGRQIYRTHRCKGCGHAAECGVSQRFKELSTYLPQTTMGRLTARMRTEEGKAILAARKEIVEPVFGDFKHNRGFDRFLLRGHKRAGGELSLKCIAHNLRIWARAAFQPAEAGTQTALLRRKFAHFSRFILGLFCYGRPARCGEIKIARFLPQTAA
jgi:hypothetical protein